MTSAEAWAAPSETPAPKKRRIEAPGSMTGVATRTVTRVISASESTGRRLTGDFSSRPGSGSHSDNRDLNSILDSISAGGF